MLNINEDQTIIDIKPCPFCDSQELIINLDLHQDDNIVCTACNIIISAFDKKELIYKWNRRAAIMTDIKDLFFKD